jgi:hypothetical protein
VLAIDRTSEYFNSESNEQPMRRLAVGLNLGRYISLAGKTVGNRGESGRGGKTKLTNRIQPYDWKEGEELL